MRTCRPATTRSCAVTGCTRPWWGKGLCAYHYQRAHRRQQPLVDPLIAKLGQPDGFGRFGYLDGVDELLCHECGRWVVGLGRHVGGVHGITATQYRQAHGLNKGAVLMGAAARAVMSQKSVARIGTPEWLRFEAARDPDTARAASATPGVYGGAAARAARVARAAAVSAAGAPARAAKYRAVTVDEQAELTSLTGTPALVVAVLRIHADRVRLADIASVLERSPAWMTVLLARHQGRG